MIEIIQEESLEDGTKESVLPKEIKQIGKPDIGERIYVENQVYEQLHPYESAMEKTAYVLLGKFDNYAGKQCVFIEAAIPLLEINFDGELPQWNDYTWGYIYKQLKRDYDDMVIVGWSMDIKGQLPNMTARVEALHQSNFGGTHQVLFLMDTLEREEAFYSNRNGHLYRREGFYIYYGKHRADAHNQEIEQKCETESAEKEIAEQKCEEEPVKDLKETRRGAYRQQLEKQGKENRGQNFSPSLLVLVVICVLGVAAYQNYQKMNKMEMALAQMQSSGAVALAETEAETEKGDETVRGTETAITPLEVEKVHGNIEKQDQAALDSNTQFNDTDKPAATGQVEAVGENAVASDAGEGDVDTVASDVGETTADVGEADTDAGKAETAAAAMATDTQGTDWLKQGYYIVQKGDNLAEICRRIYQTTAVMDKVCEVNGIDDPDAIYAGQQLTLPN